MQATMLDVSLSLKIDTIPRTSTVKFLKLKLLERFTR